MRYEKQILFRGIGEEGQKKLAQATVAIVGIGALGSVVAEQLARAGIGKLILVDHDIVEMSNLQRQTLYNEDDVNKPKAEVAKQKLQKINSEIKIEAYALHLNYENINKIKSDLIIDGTDNLDTRFLINEFCKKNNTPWIYGAVAGSQGFVYNIKEGPCFKCIMKHAIPSATCSTDGVLNSIAFTIASIQTTEALKILLNKEYCKDLQYVDLWENEFKQIKVNKDPECPVCKGEYSELKGTGKDFEIKMCKTKAAFSSKPKKNMSLDFNKIKERFKDIIIDTPILLVLKVEGEEIVIHNYGEILFKSCKDMDKMKLIADQIYA